MTWTKRCLILSVVFCWTAAAGPRIAAAQEKSDTKTKQKEKKPKKKPRPGGFKVGPKSEAHYAVDSQAARNEVTFTSKAPKETIVGKSGEVSGHLDCRPRKLRSAKGEFRVTWQSLDTGQPTRNQHMLAAPWVDAASHPEIVFKLTGIDGIKRKDKAGKSLSVKLVGTMAMNGAEKKMKIPATLVYVEPEAGKEDDVKEGVGIRAQFPVALRDFKIEGKGIGVSVAATQKIKVKLFLARAEKAEAADPEPAPPGPQPKPRRPGPRPA